MPTAPPRACPRPGCAHMQPCPDHPKGETHAEVSAARPWSRLYDTQRWRRLSTRVRMEEPVCRSCKGTPQPTRHTDHITPHRGDVGLFYDRGNLQALCGSCHSEKTKREMR